MCGGENNTPEDAFFFSGRNTNTVWKPPAESRNTVLHPSQSGGKSAGQELLCK